MLSYGLGKIDGRVDAQIMACPIKTGGHTFTFYVETRAKYEESVFTFTPSDYQRGYADGFDEVAKSRGF